MATKTTASFRPHIARSPLEVRLVLEADTEVCGHQDVDALAQTCTPSFQLTPLSLKAHVEVADPDGLRSEQNGKLDPGTARWGIIPADTSKKGFYVPQSADWATITDSGHKLLVRKDTFAGGT